MIQDRINVQNEGYLAELEVKSTVRPTVKLAFVEGKLESHRAD
jgi:hypothetical protein